MIKVALCDDDVSSLNQTTHFLEQYQRERNQEISCTVFYNPLELLAELEKGTSFDILFLDIIMPGEDGISTAKEIRQYDSNVKIIFLTTSSEFAVQSYTVDAYFYQLKPICKENLFRLMDSAISDCKKEKKESLIVRCKSGITRIVLDQLEYCEVTGRKLFFYLEDGKVLECSGSLEELCNELAQYPNFLRPHRSFVINMEYVESISSRAITMTNSLKIPIPHGKYTEIKNRYLEYIFDRKQVFLS